MPNREFPLGTVLTVVTGRMLSPDGMDGVYDILQYMTRNPVATHQIPRALSECRPYVIMQYPALGPLLVPSILMLDVALATGGDSAIKAAIVARWVAQVASINALPAQLEIEAIPADDCEARDPVEELAEMIGADRVIVVEKPV